jgi:hypothetical protein
MLRFAANSCMMVVAALLVSLQYKTQSEAEDESDLALLTARTHPQATLHTNSEYTGHISCNNAAAAAARQTTESQHPTRNQDQAKPGSARPRKQGVTRPRTRQQATQKRQDKKEKHEETGTTNRRTEREDSENRKPNTSNQTRVTRAPSQATTQQQQQRNSSNFAGSSAVTRLIGCCLVVCLLLGCLVGWLSGVGCLGGWLVVW